MQRCQSSNAESRCSSLCISHRQVFKLPNPARLLDPTSPLPFGFFFSFPWSQRRVRTDNISWEEGSATPRRLCLLPRLLNHTHKILRGKCCELSSSRLIVLEVLRQWDQEGGNVVQLWALGGGHGGKLLVPWGCGSYERVGYQKQLGANPSLCFLAQQVTSR